MEEKQNPLIKIDDAYGISVDPIDYSLRKIVTSGKSGKVRQEIVGYYSSIANCLNAYVKEKIHDCLETDTDMTLKEALQKILSTVDHVRKTVEQTFPEYEVTAR